MTETSHPAVPAEFEVVDFMDERVNMSHWFPVVDDLDVPTPTTKRLEIAPGTDEPIEWDNEAACELVESLGGTAFIRSGRSSGDGEHSQLIKSPDPLQVKRTIKALVVDHMMAQMKLGEALWFREWLDLDHPVATEVRTYIRDGEVVCAHPRLDDLHRAKDKEAAYERTQAALDADWESTLKPHAETVAAAMDGWWSLDFVQDTNGDWYCTDMALDAIYERDGQYIEMSWHPDDCENRLEPHCNHP